MAKSPWVYGIQHPRHEEEKTAPFVDWIISADIQMLDSIWIMHSSPRYIEMTGKELKDIFFCGTQMSYDAVDLSVRRLRQLDCKMCRISNTPRWRHMLESDFGVICLAGEDPIQSKSIREQFIGDIIDYNISSCRMIVIPVRATSNWCCYFWDFKNNIVHVVDPLHDGSTISEESHVATIGILQKCLSTCMQTFFDGWYHSFDGWNNEFIILPKQANGSSSGNNSGLITVLAARDFDGSCIASNAYQNFKINLMFELLSIMDNCATPPSSFIEAIDR